MPGYLIIPFNFELEKLKNYFNENKSELFRIRKRVKIKLKFQFIEENKEINKVKQELINTFKFSSIKENVYEGSPLKKPLNNAQIIQISLKSLKKILIEKYSNLLFEETDLIISFKQEKETNNPNELRIIIPINERNINDKINNFLFQNKKLKLNQNNLFNLYNHNFNN